VKTMLTDEYGLPQEARSPWLAAISTFSACLVCGVAPLYTPISAAWFDSGSRLP
jgi:hypothetical protein